MRLSFLPRIGCLTFLLAVALQGASLGQTRPEPFPAPGERIRPEGIPAGETTADSELTLSAAEQLALANSPRLREAVALASAAWGKAAQAGLPKNPELGTGAPQLNGRGSQYEVFLRQEVVAPRKLRLDRSAAAAAAQQADLKVLQTRFELLTLVRERYIVALAAQQREEIAAELVAIAQKSKQIGQQLLAAGEGTRTDSLGLEIECDRAELELQNAAARIEADKRRLAAVLGIPDLVISRLAGDLEAPLADFDRLAEDRERLSENAPARIAQMEVGRAQILARRAEIEPLPSVNLTGGYLSQVAEPNDMATYEISITTPLWDRNRGNIRAARSNVGAAAAQADRVRHEQAAALAAAGGRYQVARQGVERYRDQILPKARSAQQLVQKLYAVGQTDYLRLLQSQRTRVEADLAYIEALERLWIAAAEAAGLLYVESFPE